MRDMEKMKASFAFRHIEADNLPLLHRWLQTPHVREWWADEPETLAGVVEQFHVRLREEPATRCFLILHSNRPIGYIQTYRIDDEPEYARAVQPTELSAGVDLYIGEEDSVHRGLGAAILRAFLRELVFADAAVETCLIGPDVRNRIAIRAYEKAGFTYWKTVDVPGEPAPEYMMRLTRHEFERMEQANAATVQNDTAGGERRTEMRLMQDKRVLVTGVRNKWSIGWGCAQSLLRAGATVAFSAYNERERDDVKKLLDGSEIEGANGCPIFLCDATKMEQVERLFGEVGTSFEGQLDGLLHSIAFTTRESIKGEYVATLQPDFALALDSSVYTLVALARGARPLMQAAGGGAVASLTYLGAERVIPNYNVMGVAKAALEASTRYLANDLGPDNIRVNAVSAGPIKTLAAGAIAGFSDMLKHVAETAPLRRGVDTEEVGDAVTFLLSDMARAITGEVLYVDAGYHIMGM